MARITVGGTTGDIVTGPGGAGLRTASILRWYASADGAQLTGLLLNGQSVDEIPVPAGGYFPEHQWPDGVTVAWVAASTTSDGFAYARRYKYVPPGAGGGGETLPSTNFGKSLLVAPDAPTTRGLLGIVPDSVVFSSASPATGASGSDRASQARTLTQARMRVATAPVGSALTVRVQHSTNSGTSWTDAATLTIAAGSTTEAVSSTLNVAQAVGDLARIFVDSVGSTTPATGVVVDLVMA